MAVRNDLSDALRALGRMLDEERVPALAGVDVAVFGPFAQIIMLDPSNAAARHPRRLELAALRAQARVRGTQESSIPQPSHAERLRTIGQELDALGVDLERVTIVAEGHRAFGQLRGHSFGQWFTTEMIDQLSEQRRLLRAPVSQAASI